MGEGKPSVACELCHAKDSHHQDRFKEFGSPPRCGTCHPSGGPKFVPSAFNHGTRTRFKLEFKHAEVACRQCHRGGNPSDFENFQGLIDKQGKVDCIGCHAHKKVHADPDHPDGKYKGHATCTPGNKDSCKCLSCHMHPGDPTIRKGKDNQIVDDAHNKVHGTFPLIKGHENVPCNDCH